MSFAWHGWVLGDHVSSLNIGPVPGRKGLALYRTSGTESVVLAYFVNEEAARSAMSAFDNLFDLAEAAIAGRPEVPLEAPCTPEPAQELLPHLPGDWTGH